LSARSPTAMPRSAMLGGDAIWFSYDSTNRCDVI
jgi:hypothetical protein